CSAIDRRHDLIKDARGLKNRTAGQRRLARTTSVGEGRVMRIANKLGLDVAAASIAALFLVMGSPLRAEQVAIGDTELRGGVASVNGPEAGVWVIAETTDLPTKFAKIVVTDGAGRYLLPELPKATYSV